MSEKSTGGGAAGGAAAGDSGIIYILDPELEDIFNQDVEPSFCNQEMNDNEPIDANKKGLAMTAAAALDKSCIDLYSLKILSLLVCRDSAKVKMKLFVEIIYGQDARMKFPVNGLIDLGSARLKRAIKLLLYFAEIFPKKYWMQFDRDVKEAKFREDGTLAGTGFKLDNDVFEKCLVPLDGFQDWAIEYVNAEERHLIHNFDKIFETHFRTQIFGVAAPTSGQ